MLILIVAVILNMALGDFTNTWIILAIVFLSGILGFWQERRADRALQRLRALVQVRATVIREGLEHEIAAQEVVPGDIILLKAGDMIPGDALLLQVNDLHVNEAVLTGESFPTEKEPGLLAPDTPVIRRRNCVFQGTNVVNGAAKAVIVHTGGDSEFGRNARSLEKHVPETAFEIGIRHFGSLILRVTFLLSLLILILNLLLGKPASEALLFGLALAVGMAPEMLPAIVTITLSAGARRMAGKEVIVKRLSSIQNLGSVDVFCSDKTGTLTTGVVAVQEAVGFDGKPWARVAQYAYINASFETGFANPMDEAIRALKEFSTEGFTKVDEVPYDFIRKRLSIAVSKDDRHLLISKGALLHVLDVCTRAERPDGQTVEIDSVRDAIGRLQADYSSRGFRTIGVCYKDITGDPVINKADEVDMIFLGLVVLADTIKEGIEETVGSLRNCGIALKVITGDHRLVAAHVASRIGLRANPVMTGEDIDQLTDEALEKRVSEVDVFAETEPRQKERLVRAHRQAGHVVGYIGDGINDVGALKAADVSISVDSAVDVAKDTADIVFLRKDLRVLLDGVLEGRKTLQNTMKYIFVTTSANFGNMFSVAGTSLFLPFLPLLPKQILLINFLSDIPAMTIASDSVDKELLLKPSRWDNRLIRNFMIVFGVESSLFDFFTFGVLLWVYQAHESLFQTGWFMESVLTEIIILLVIRSRYPLWRSLPSRPLVLAVGMVGVVNLILPYLPFAVNLGLVPLPSHLLVTMVAIAVAYAILTELTKQYFFRVMKV